MQHQPVTEDIVLRDGHHVQHSSEPSDDTVLRDGVHIRHGPPKADSEDDESDIAPVATKRASNRRSLRGGSEPETNVYLKRIDAVLPSSVSSLQIAPS